MGREQIIEANVVEGKTHRKIAEALGRSEHTIRGVLRTLAANLLTRAGVIDIPKPEKDSAPQFLIQIGGGSVRDIVWDEAEVTEPPVLPASSP